MTHSTPLLSTLVASTALLNLMACHEDGEDYDPGSCPIVEEISYSYDYTVDDVLEQAAQIPVSYTQSNTEGTTYTLTLTELTVAPLDDTARQQALFAKLMPVDLDTLPISRLICIPLNLPEQTVEVTGRFTLTRTSHRSTDTTTLYLNEAFSSTYTQRGEHWESSTGIMDILIEDGLHYLWMEFASQTPQGADLKLFPIRGSAL